MYSEFILFSFINISVLDLTPVKLFPLAPSFISIENVFR
jgi:hypothetical protein